MKKVINKPWDYSLFESDGKYLLEVLCGSVGMYQLKIWLNASEKESYLEQGDEYIDRLSKSIQRSPNSYKDRIVK
jgi:carbohydrate-binding DOMON domain-containing protein